MSPVVKERAWLMRQDMLPGIKSRAFKHQNLNDPRDKLCNVLIDGHPCDIEETLIHFFCECPGTQAVWNNIKNKVLTYTDNVNKYPPISDIQFLFLDFDSCKVKMKTAAWVVSNMCSKIYEFKLAKKVLIFDELFEIIATDFKIAKYCKGGEKLDVSFFD